MYSCYRIAFDGKGEWSFGDGFARNVIIFGVDSSSPSHTDNLKNDFLILGEGNTFGINGSFGAPEKKMEKKSINLKLVIKMITFLLDFVLEAHLMNVTAMI